jgi:hypothetical protein
MTKSFFSSITNTATLLLNTPIVAPPPKGMRAVALLELAPTPRRRIEALDLARSRSADPAARDDIRPEVSKQP